MRLGEWGKNLLVGLEEWRNVELYISKIASEIKGLIVKHDRDRLRRCLL